MKKFKRKHLVISILLLFLFIFIIHNCVILSDKELKNSFFLYPEETYQKLENQAVEIIKSDSSLINTVDEIFHLKFKLISEDPACSVTAEVYNHDEPELVINLKRNYSSPTEMIVLSEFLIAFASGIGTLIFVILIAVLKWIINFIISTVKNL